MTDYKIINATELDAEMTEVADAIRAKAGTSDELFWPDGFKSAIEGISAGGGSAVEACTVSVTVYGGCFNELIYTTVKNDAGLIIEEPEYMNWGIDDDYTTTLTCAKNSWIIFNGNFGGGSINRDSSGKCYYSLDTYYSQVFSVEGDGSVLVGPY